MKILLAPFTANNPYQRDLIAGLQSHGGRVEIRDALQHLPFWLGAFDVLHLHWLHPYYRGGYAATRLARMALFILSMLGARVSGCKVVWTVHNLRAHESNHPVLDGFITRVVVRLAAGFIVHCDWAKREFLSAYPNVPQERIAVIPHGHYIDAYEAPPDRDVARQALSIPKGHTAFLFFGYIRPYKGVEDLIEAFSAISAGGQEVTLIIAGKPANKALGEKIAALCADLDHVHLQLGFIDDASVPVLFAAADFYVLPYRHIVTSGAAVLGMSMACALIAPTLGCMPDMLDDEGALLFDPQASGALAGSMQRAVSDATLDAGKMGLHNRALAEQWAWPTIAQTTQQFFRSTGQGQRG